MLFTEAHRILLCLRYGIGDLVMETPVLETLKRASPQAEIHVLGARPAVELLEGDPRVDRIACIQDLGLGHWGDYGTDEVRQAIRGWLDRENFDLILDPSHAVFGVREIIWERSGPILDAGGEAQNRALREGAGGLAAIKSSARENWGMEIPDRIRPRIHLRQEDEEFAENLLLGRSALGNPLIGLSPAASSPLKRWPVERLAQVGDRLAEHPDVRILLFGSSESDDFAGYLSASRRPGQTIHAGNLHLCRVAALLRRCRFFICNDTGLMHMAAAMGVPVFAIFGPTSPAIYYPCGPGAAMGGEDFCPYRYTERFGPPDCLVCGSCRMEIRSCIDAVSSARVLMEVENYTRGVLSAEARQGW